MFARRSPHDYVTVEPIARAARYINVALGAWLFLSAFMFRPFPELAFHDALVGTLILGLSAAALFVKREFHMVNVPLAVWLFASAFVLPGRSPMMMANDMLVAALVFGFASVGDGHHEPPLGEFH